MSMETLTWLNQNTLVGFTDKRGNAWHYRASEQGAEPNHYAGAIPAGDVRRRLFGWTPTSRRVAVELPATFENMTHLNEEGLPVRWVVQDDLQAITRDDDRLGLFKQGYKIHYYDQWLLDNVESILGQGLSISSAGLLKGGAVAWVEVSVPETITTPEGVAFRPNLLCGTSLDGTLATTYKRTVQFTVCDNTLSIALGENGPQIKRKHSTHSLAKVADVRAALAMVHDTAEITAQAITKATSTKVTDLQFKQVLHSLVPFDPQGSKRGQTIATEKREQISALWLNDPRVAPWTGTALGVTQAFNTWRHHVQGGLPKGGEDAQAAARADRNALRALSGETQVEDAKVAAALAAVLA